MWVLAVRLRSLSAKAQESRRRRFLLLTLQDEATPHRRTQILAPVIEEQWEGAAQGEHPELSGVELA